MITVALPKGRTLGATLDRFARAGLVPEEDFSTTRKLIVPARGTQARFVLLKDPDVPLYVERGAARDNRHAPNPRSTGTSRSAPDSRT